MKACTLARELLLRGLSGRKTILLSSLVHSNIMTKLLISFRWEAKQIGSDQVEVLVPEGPNQLLNPQAVKELNLTDGELEKAEYAALKAIAVLN